MKKEPFYELENNYEKIEKIFGPDFALKSFLDELSPEEVVKANDRLADIVYGEEYSYLFKKKYVSQIKKNRDSLIPKYDKGLEEKLDLNSYGVILLRPETLGNYSEYVSFLKTIGLEVVFQKNIQIDFEQYFLLYGDGIMMGLSYNDDLFDFPTRTFNYINNTCSLLVVKSINPLEIPVSEYLHRFKGKHGKYVKDTFRGDIAFSALAPYAINGQTLVNCANVPLDPIGAYRALVRNEVESDGWHDKVDYPILFYSGQAVHIPNREEINRDMSVLCNDEDIKTLSLKK